MATWIGHLRIAEHLLKHLPVLDETAFAFGSLSPDSGRPNADWSEFDPPKTITHFLQPNDDEDKIHDLTFYRQYLADVHPDENRTLYSFSLGYFLHLIADNLWARRINRTYRQVYTQQIAEQGSKFGWEVKKDWYGLDYKYLRDQPDSLFWRVILNAPNPPALLPFLVEDALHYSLDYIRDSYRTLKPDDVLDRVYPYLNETTMNRYVEDAISASLLILRALDHKPTLDGQNSALFLLPEALLEPYPPPLGDV